MEKINEPTFEYLIINDQEDGNPDSVEELNDFGQKGWELVMVLEDAIGVRRWFFKRRLKYSWRGWDEEN